MADSIPRFPTLSEPAAWPPAEGDARRPADLLRLLAFLKPLAGWVALSVLLGALTVAAAIGLMAASAYLISAAALRPSVADLQVMIVGVRFFGLSRGAFRYLERLVSHSANFRLLARLRVWFYQRIEPLAPARLVRESGGDLLARAVTDIDALEAFYVRVVAPPLVALVILAGMSVFLGGFHPALAAGQAIFMLLAGVALPAVVRLSSRRAGRDQVLARARISTAWVDDLQGLAEITAFGARGERLRQMAALNDRLARAQRRLAWVNAAQSALGGLLANLGAGAALLTGIILVRAGALDGVQLAVVTLASLAAFEAVTPLPPAAQLLESSLPAARRLFEIADRAPAVTDGKPPVPADGAPAAPRPNGGDLRITGLSFRYAPGLPPALDDLDLSLPAGRKLALLGPSGAGKSTLAALLARFWDYEQGRITLGGVDLRALTQEETRRRIGLITQSTYLFNGTLRANLLLADPRADPARLDWAARLAQLDEVIARLPDGYETPVGERGMKLSGGERQRVAIARALLHGAPLLVLDEPTAHLDALTAQAFLNALLAAAGDKSLLLITHRLAGLDALDEIVVLDAGRVVARGTHAALLQTSPLYRALWQLEQAVIEDEQAQ